MGKCRRRAVFWFSIGIRQSAIIFPCFCRSRIVTYGLSISLRHGFRRNRCRTPLSVMMAVTNQEVMDG